MTDAAPPPVLTAAEVESLARLAGYPSLDAETAARIAVGASNAAAAVRASVSHSLFDAEPGQFVMELERLADATP